MGGSRSNRMSSMVAGDKPRSKSVVSTSSGTTNVTAGAPVTNLGANIKSKKEITDRVSAPKNIPRTYVRAQPTAFVPGGFGVMPPVSARFFPTKLAPKATVVAKKPTTKPAVKPAAQVISNVTNEKPSPAKAPPARMAVNARTGNTTGFTTGKTTGTSASKPGVAGRTAQSAYGRQMANAMNRTNQPAGPMGGGGGRIGGGGGGGRSGGSLSGGGSGGRQAGTSRTGGTRTNEPAGPKRG
jgi:hypothetical protein